jgi:hypothetical protein
MNSEGANHGARSPLYQICLVVDMAEKGIKLDKDKLLWHVLTEKRGEMPVWKAIRTCGSVLYASTLPRLRKIMIEYEESLGGNING